MFEQPGDQQIAPDEDATTGEGTAADPQQGGDADAQQGGDADAQQVADAVDQQAQESSGTAAEGEPEVPDDASQKIREAQEHIERLNMDEQRSQAKRVM